MEYFFDKEKQTKCVKGLKVAYIGGGSRGWAWTLMNDLAKAFDMEGTLYLYDIDYASAEANAIIGKGICPTWNLVATKTQKEALEDADFVIISILPATFDEMAVDVHTAEQYGIYQSVGDTTGPGGFIRALRTIPMMRAIARDVKAYCPDAWVINYTNPMAICVGALYKEFPQIKAFGCCHEVFGTQGLLANALKDVMGIADIPREDINVNVVGINHFTWFTSAHYQGLDLFPIYRQFVDKYYENGYDEGGHKNWANNSFTNAARVRFDLFKRYGYIAAAGDRHLAEFCAPDEYLKNPDVVRSWCFGLTPVSWRREDLKARLKRSADLLSGAEKYELRDTGEEGVLQMQALLGLRNKLVTNINIPNRGQIANLPLGAVVETNAVLSDNMLCPVVAGSIPDSIYPIISRNLNENERTVEAAFSEDLSLCYPVFAEGHLLDDLTDTQKRSLFDQMIDGTKAYLTMYH